MTTTLITGGHEGLGYETARRLAAAGHHVVIGSRDAERGRAAVTMLTTVYAQFLPELRINVVDPGYTATDLNGRAGVQTVTEGTDAIVAMASIGPDGPTGRFSDRHGPLGW